MYSILDLFSGIGGFSLGLHSASDKFYTTAFCESNIYCQAVLKKNFKNTPIFNDIKKLNVKKYEKTTTIKPFIITGGYPCQPFTTAGERKGKEDFRNLWSEMFRLIKELKPVWVLAENVVGHITLGLDKVLYDLENENYTTQTFIIPAKGVGANQQRNRIFIISYSPSSRSSFGLSKERHRKKGNTKKFINNYYRNGGRKRKDNWATEPNVGRVVDGISPFRVDRIKALGNSIVPQIAEIIGKAIISHEEQINSI